MDLKQFRNSLFETTATSFEGKAIDLFHYQANNNPIYKSFIENLNIDSTNVTEVTQIPFLPIEFFKSQIIKCAAWKEEITFSSSGTTGNNTSIHHISSLKFYKDNTEHIFKKIYGSPSDYIILALLPSYLERSGSGLITMAQHFIELGQHEQSGFYLYNHKDLYSQLKTLKKQNKKTLLIGVTFGLLDFVEEYSIDFPELIVMETGGMKGRKKELTRNEVHTILKTGFNTSNIHSEYGMTELQSQAYSTSKGIFKTPPWMKVMIRENDDPLSLAKNGKTGGINIIDLANKDTCAFIATQDLGKLHADNSFEVLGRFDHADTRGCNLMIE